MHLPTLTPPTGIWHAHANAHAALLWRPEGGRARDYLHALETWGDSVPPKRLPPQPQLYPIAEDGMIRTCLHLTDERPGDEEPSDKPIRNKTMTISSKQYQSLQAEARRMAEELPKTQLLHLLPACGRG